MARETLPKGSSEVSKLGKRSIASARQTRMQIEAGHALKSHESVTRIAELEQVCAELYQVIGSLADHANCFDHPDVQRALDNAAKARLIHRDLLPWPKSPWRTNI